MRKSTNKLGPSVVIPKEETSNPQPFTGCQPKETEWDWETVYKDRLGKLLETGFQSDLTIVVKSTEYRVHKIFLQSGSRVFNDRIKRCGSERLILKDCSADPDIFRMCLNYLYFGESGVRVDHALSLLKLATQFEITELSTRCAELLQSSISLDNVIDIFNESTARQHKGGLISAVLDFICLNGQEILALASLNKLHVDGLVEILKQDNLSVDREIDVFNAVYRWGEAQLTSQDVPNNPENMKKGLAIPLKYVRFPLMDSKDFRERVKPKGLLDPEDAYSLLEAILQRKEEPAAVYCGLYSTTPRKYNVDTIYLESGVGRLSLITSTPLTSASQPEITVYRAGASTSVVSLAGSFPALTECLCFLPPRDGMLHRISIRAACFVGLEKALQDQSSKTEITAKLRFYENSESNEGNKQTELLNTVQNFENLPFTLADTTANGTFMSAKLPCPIPFKNSVWAGLYIIFPGCPFKRAYMSPYLDEYVHEADPSLVFKFRTWAGAPTSKRGLIDHFVVTIN